jgi:iron complex transport system ATP-binding protein
MRRLGLLMREPDGPTVLFVTHRVEEISPEVSHAVLLRDGRIVAQGPKGSALTGETFREAFGIPVDIVRDNGRLYAKIGT